MTRTRIKTSTMLRKYVFSSRAVSASMLITTVLVVFGAAIVPRTIDYLSTQELRSDLDSQPSVQRDVSSSALVDFVPGKGSSDLPDEDAAVFGLTDAAVRKIRDDASTRVRAVLGRPQYFARSTKALAASPTAPSRVLGSLSISLVADPAISSRIRFVNGSAPESHKSPAEPIDLVLSVQSAQAMDWQIGEIRGSDTRGLLRLTGIYEPLDPTDDYWAHATGILTPLIDDDGNDARKVRSAGFVASEVAGRDEISFSLTAWYPVDTGDIDPSNASSTAGQLRSFTDSSPTLPGDLLEQDFTLATSIPGTIDQSLQRIATTNVILSMVLSGPFGVAIAVLFLAARAMARRRRPTLSLLSARGSSALQIRMALAIEGLLIGVAGAAIAVSLAALCVPAHLGFTSLLPALVLAMLPSLILASIIEYKSVGRHDLGDLQLHPTRRIVDLAVVSLAVIALILLARRGLGVGGTFDPLLAATPLLLSVAVCVIVIRLIPFPLVALVSRLRQSSGLVGFIGAARAMRDPAVGAAGILAILVAVAVGVFSGTLQSTITHAAESSARSLVGGGDIIARSNALSDDEIETVASNALVRASAAIDNQGSTTIRQSGRSLRGDLLDVQAAQLSLVRADVPRGMDAPMAGKIPVLVSESLAAEFDGSREITLGGVPLTVVGIRPDDFGIRSTSRWILADSSLSESALGHAFAPQTLVVKTTRETDASAVARQIASTDEETEVTTYREALEQTLDTPAVASLTRVLELIVVAVGILAAIAIALTTVINATGRRRTVSTLRALGLSSAQSIGIAIWEIGPTVFSAITAGSALGLLLPVLVTSTVDLSSFTGGIAVTAPSYDPALIASLIGTLIVVTAGSLAVSIALSTRRTTAPLINLGAE